MAKVISNEKRLEFVCQYCYAPIVLGRPLSFDLDKNAAKTSPSNSSPLKKSSSSNAGQGVSRRNLNSRGGNRGLSPAGGSGLKSSGSSAAQLAEGGTQLPPGEEESLLRSPQEAFDSFQKVLVELEKENEAKGNPQLRVTSINPLILMPINSQEDADNQDEEETSSPPHFTTSDAAEDGDISDDKDTNDSNNQDLINDDPNGATSQLTTTDAGEVKETEEQEQLPPQLFTSERTPAHNETNTNLLPYSKEVVDAVFDSLSECSALDFPICCTCADGLILKLNNKAEELTGECRALLEQRLEEQQMLDQISQLNGITMNDSETTGSDSNGDHLDAIIAQLENEEANLLKELEEMEREREDLERENRQLVAEEHRMMQEERELSTENNQLQHEIYDLETSLKSVTEQLKFSEDHFNALKKTNVFNLVFNIWHHDNKFGTINGFRLGKLNSDSQAGSGGPGMGGRVEWSEINMALGQSCLLLHCLITKLNFQPNIYTLVPCGARSYIEASHPSPAGGGGVSREKLNLYSEGGNKFFYDSSIDSAMKAFLNVLDQFRATLEQKNSEFRLPYPMKGEMIYEKQNSDIGYSVCPGRASSSEMWTKACRMMLTNLKWGIVGVCTISAHPSDWLQPPQPQSNLNTLNPPNGGGGPGGFRDRESHQQQMVTRGRVSTSSNSSGNTSRGGVPINQQLYVQSGDIRQSRTGHRI